MLGMFHLEYQIKDEMMNERFDYEAFKITKVIKEVMKKLNLSFICGENNKSFTEHFFFWGFSVQISCTLLDRARLAFSSFPVLTLRYYMHIIPVMYCSY